MILVVPSAIITPDSSLMTVKAQTPSYLAWLAGYSNANDDLSQTVAIPAGVIGDPSIR